MSSPVRCCRISRYCAAAEGVSHEGKGIISTIVVRYRPKADRADENEKLVEAVFAELAASDPGGVRYATYKLADGTFIHIADVDTDPNPLGSIAAFAEFQKDIADRCEEGEGPNPQPAELIGNYRLLDT